MEDSLRSQVVTLLIGYTIAMGTVVDDLEMTSETRRARRLQTMKVMQRPNICITTNNRNSYSMAETSDNERHRLDFKKSLTVWCIMKEFGIQKNVIMIIQNLCIYTVSQKLEPYSFEHNFRKHCPNSFTVADRN